MARIATLLLASTLTPVLDIGVYNVQREVVFPATVIANTDHVPLFTIQRDGRLTAADINTSATLGAGATVQLALYRNNVLVRNLTAATAAGAAGYGNSNALGPINVLAGDEICAVVGGANVTASATITADVRLQHGGRC